MGGYGFYMSTMKKQLPIQVDTGIKSECWTSFKLGIILNSRFAAEWISCHFDIYMEDNGSVVFGNNFTIYPLNYFRDILDICEVDIWAEDFGCVVPHIIEQIDRENYVFVDCFMNDYVHERLICGYNLESKILYSFFINENWKWEKIEIRFEIIEDEFKKAKMFLNENKHDRFMRRNWFYSFTAIKIKDYYRNDNAIFEMLKKIENEIHGCKIIRNEDAFLQRDENRNVYTGMACLLGVIDVLESGSFVTYKLTLALLKLYEHRKMIVKSMGWLLYEKKVISSQLEKLMKKYEEATLFFEQLYLISYKNDLKPQADFKSKIIANLHNQYYEEKEILNDFYLEAVKIYS